MTKNNLWDTIHSNDLLTMDGYDDCIIGIGYRCEMEPYVVYDTNKIINKLMKENNMSWYEAAEYHEFNQACAYVGPNTPGFIELIQ
jgi:hypothetical protein